MRKAFSHFLKRAHWTKSGASHDAKRMLSKGNACYVLITCGQPTEEGNMQVEMTYEGDACLAAYLIESAQGFIDHQAD